MADLKITELPALGAQPADADILALVDDPAGSPETKKVTVAELLAGAGGAGSSLILFNVPETNCIRNDVLSYVGHRSTLKNYIDLRVGAIISKAGTLKNLYVYLGANTLNGNFVTTVYINGVAKSIVATLGAGVTTGNDTAHTEAVAAGDRVTLKLDGTVSGAGQGDYLCAGLEIAF